MSKYTNNFIHLRIETLRSRLVRLIEPRIHNYRFYAHAERAVRLDGQMKKMPVDLPVDHYYIADFLVTEIPKLNGMIYELVSDRQSPFLATTLIAQFSPEMSRSMLSQVKTVTIDELSTLPDGSCANIIANRILNETADPIAVLAEIHRTIAPEGSVLATLSAFAPSANKEGVGLGFSPAAAAYLFEKEFSDRTVAVTGQGNVLVGRMFLSNQRTGKLSKEILDFSDPYFPVLSCVKVSPKKTL